MSRSGPLKRDRYTITAETLQLVLDALETLWQSGLEEGLDEMVIESQDALLEDIGAEEEP